MPELEIGRCILPDLKPIDLRVADFFMCRHSQVMEILEKGQELSSAEQEGIQGCKVAADT